MITPSFSSACWLMLILRSGTCGDTYSAENDCRDPTVAKTEYCFYTENKLSLTDAVKHCKSRKDRDLSWTLVEDDSEEKHQHLQSFLTGENTQVGGPLVSIWTPLKRTKYAGLYTSDGSEFNGLTPKNSYSCGYLDTRTKTFGEATNCRQPSAIASTCHIPVCKGCPTSTGPNAKCVQEESSCFTFHCADHSWFNARARCRIQGGKLLAPDQAGKDFAVKHNASLCSPRVWVDLMNQDWFIYHDMLIKGQKAVFWDDNEPHPQGDCVIISTSTDNQNAAVWRTAECYEQHHVVCQATGRNTTEESNTYTTEESNTSSGYVNPTNVPHVSTTVTQKFYEGHHNGVEVATLTLVCLALFAAAAVFLFKHREIIRRWIEFIISWFQMQRNQENENKSLSMENRSNKCDEKNKVSPENVVLMVENQSSNTTSDSKTL